MLYPWFYHPTFPVSCLPRHLPTAEIWTQWHQDACLWVANAFFLVYVPGPREVSPVPIVFVFRVLSGQCRKNLNAQDGLDVGPGQGVGILVCLPSRMPPLVPVRKLHGREFSSPSGRFERDTTLGFRPSSHTCSSGRGPESAKGRRTRCRKP